MHRAETTHEGIRGAGQGAARGGAEQLIAAERKQGKSAEAATAAASAAPAVDLVDWCSTQAVGSDYTTRDSACLKSIGSAKLIFTDTDPDHPVLASADFDIEQRLKTYPNKGASGSDFAEFDQQLYLVPLRIDPALRGVTIRWNEQHTCISCVTSNVRWADDANVTRMGSSAYWNAADIVPPYGGRWGTVQTTWTGTGKETISLGWSMTATVDASSTASASSDLGTSGIPQVRELAPRCDDIVGGSAPGCTLPYYVPTYFVDTNKYPAASAYYWWMQQVLPSHTGSRQWDSLLHYLGPDTTVKTSTGRTWTSKNSRDRVCDSSWSLPPTNPLMTESMDCDEYPMASTHESAGFPDNPNKVASGSECAQFYLDTDDGRPQWLGVFPDTRAAPHGPTRNEPCGRATVPRVQNQEAFHKFPAPAWRMLDGDGFFVGLPGFEHYPTPLWGLAPWGGGGWRYWNVPS
ncbi:hypothetical protein ADK75_30175 [Streptomyces virginiae]|uniref:Uncharacterized protein n=1 Tax=Streptomyces virginiae TaxID=1961 RepID=A0A0L8M5S6_STRVG|nr:hypothetical protein [Streptomyces virginiae]KOG45725.1 hypothetical protein ADK75_30175 [Streptomyces virginiae]